jgi:hypothetical protein
MDINELIELHELEPYDKSYAMLHLYFTVRRLVKRFLSLIWYYL